MLVDSFEASCTMPLMLLVVVDVVAYVMHVSSYRAAALLLAVDCPLMLLFVTAIAFT